MTKKLLLFIITVSLCGCGVSIESRLDNVRAEYMQNEVSDTDFSDKNNLDLLLTADALFHADKYTESDSAYEEFNHRNISSTTGSITREAVGLVVNPNVNSYRPYMMDNLFVSYYQLWNALALKKYDDARVIINQSYARQQDMSIEYKKLIEENQKSSIKNSELVSELNEENSQWNAYRDIMNPALMYLSGIYFLNNGDYSDAELYLKRANGMMPENQSIIRDLKLAESKKRPENTVWVFVEDGFAPKLTERRITLPFISSGGVTTLTIATSEPVLNYDFAEFDNTELLADVDAMFMTEYREYRVNDALRAFASTASRAALQTTMYNSNSKMAPVMGIFSTLYSEITAGADLRTWATLPKTISVRRMINNKSGLIVLGSDDSIGIKMKIPTAPGNYLVYIRVGPNGNDIKTIKLK